MLVCGVVWARKSGVSFVASVQLHAEPHGWQR